MSFQARKVRIIINPKSGLGRSPGSLINVIEKNWQDASANIAYQVSRSVEDGKAKALEAIRDRVDDVIVVGGDGMVNTIGGVLLGSEVALGVIPAGSGNGFARHFGIPLNPAAAVQALSTSRELHIDVGVANDRPFFVTCGMAADAELVKHFEKSPVRGILPYVLATAYEIFDYEPQSFRVVLDEQEELTFDNVLVFTVANLTQFGGGARIAPKACPDDGFLEMVVVKRQDVAGLLEGVPRLFGGTLDQLPGVITRRFQRLDVIRRHDSAIQVDGEVLEAPSQVTVRVRRTALKVMVPVTR